MCSMIRERIDGCVRFCYKMVIVLTSDALTYAPETFQEFFNQRRRWMPSTIANKLDLLRDARHTVLVNENISLLYIFYQGFLLASTILGPGTILLTVASSFRTVFTSLTLAESYTLALSPAFILFDYLSQDEARNSGLK